MYNNRRKVQPLSLNDLLKMRTELETRLEAMRGEGVADTARLEELYERCKTAISCARIDRSVSALSAGVSR
jgi:hypothetical protein